MDQASSSHLGLVGYSRLSIFFIFTWVSLLGFLYNVHKRMIIYNGWKIGQSGKLSGSALSTPISDLQGSPQGGCSTSPRTSCRSARGL